MGNILRTESFKEFYRNSSKIGDIDPNIWMSNYLVNRLEMNFDQILWFCFLNSITYHLPTAYLIFNEYPDLELVNEHRIREWWLDVQKDCPFQRDKIKQRKFLPETILSYQKLVGTSQKSFFDKLLKGKSDENFDIIWNTLYLNIEHFGRFSVWNWTQMLKQVAGYDIQPNKLFLGESNAESHTHGLCKAFGKDEWAFKERYVENGKRKKRVYKFTPEDKEWLETQATTLKEELELQDESVDLFYIETVACAYKKLFRERDSRYIGFYLDRQAEDIKGIENNGFNGVDWSILWDARNELLDEQHLSNSVSKDKFKLSFENKIKSVDAKVSMDEWI